MNAVAKQSVEYRDRDGNDHFNNNDVHFVFGSLNQGMEGGQISGFRGLSVPQPATVMGTWSWVSLTHLWVHALLDGSELF